MYSGRRLVKPSRSISENLLREVDLILRNYETLQLILIFNSSTLSNFCKLRCISFSGGRKHPGETRLGGAFGPV